MYNSDQHPKLAPTPTWSPQPAEISNFLPYDSFAGSYQNGLTSQIYPSNNGHGYRNDANFHCPTNVERNSAQMNVIDHSALLVVSNDATEKDKNDKRKKSNAESKAREREHIKSIEESHIKNDELVNEIKYKFQLWDGYDPYSRYLLQKLCKDYKSIPKKQRMQKSLNGNLNNGTSSSAKTSYYVPHGNFDYHPDLVLHSRVIYLPHQVPQYEHDELHSSEWNSEPQELEYNEHEVIETSPSRFIKKEQMLDTSDDDKDEDDTDGATESSDEIPEFEDIIESGDEE
uniref:Uncharacterized protein n=1 Tax=Panagrolaimus davidi TaxID=227884 RepID=A0A914QBC1_9BILA